jgi:hypothetical protein
MVAGADPGMAVSTAMLLSPILSCTRKPLARRNYLCVQRVSPRIHHHGCVPAWNRLLILL